MNLRPPRFRFAVSPEQSPIEEGRRPFRPRLWRLCLRWLMLCAPVCAGGALIPATAIAQSSVTLAWYPSPSPNLAGYRIYYGARSRTYTNVSEVGIVTNATISGLRQGTMYFFAATARDTLGLESDFSNEASYTVPATNPVPPLPTIALTTPANGTTYTAPASITLNAGIAANGHTINNAQFYNGQTLLGQDATAPYSLVWSNAQAGTYTLSAKAVYDGGSVVSSAPVSVTVQGLPVPWSTLDIGSVGIPGSSSVANGTYTIQGAGTLSGSADGACFLYQSLSGDGEIRCKIESVQNTGAAGCVGAMIRETLTSGSKYVMMGMTPDGIFRSQRRTRTSGNTSGAKAGSATPPNAWVRVIRNGDTLTTYTSTEGSTWIRVTSTRVSMASNIYVGLAVASGNSTTLNRSVFTDVTVIP